MFSSWGFGSLKTGVWVKSVRHFGRGAFAQCIRVFLCFACESVYYHAHSSVLGAAFAVSLYLSVSLSVSVSLSPSVSGVVDYVFQ